MTDMNRPKWQDKVSSRYTDDPAGDNDNKVCVFFDELKSDTEDSYCVLIDGKRHYFPKSLTTIYPRTKKLFTPEWIAQKKGLI